MYPVQTHITAKVVGMFGMENLRSVPNEAANAFQPVKIILVYHLRYESKEAICKTSTVV